jgi:Phospholipase A2-like domain
MENNSEMVKVVDETDLDIVDVFNKCLPFEKHIPGMMYCGPGTDLSKKLDEDGVSPKKGFEPVDRVDEAALKHDIKYSQYPDLRHRNQADKEMILELRNIENPTMREKFERCIVLPILILKRVIGSLILKWFCTPREIA